MTKEKLMNSAKKASRNAYAPYSGFKLGAAVITDKNNTYTGCNIENASYSLTVCAERVAIFKAVENNDQVIKEIAIYVDSDKSFPPCGACRQVMSEFGENLKVYYQSKNGEMISTTLEKLLPSGFSLDEK